MYDINHYKTLFISKLNSLKRRIDNLDNFSIIEATQELRSFLFDSPSLLDILTKGKDFKVEFKVRHMTFMDAPAGSIPLFLWKDIYPNQLDLQAKLIRISFYNMIASIITVKNLRFYR